MIYLIPVFIALLIIAIAVWANRKKIKHIQFGPNGLSFDFYRK